MYSYVTKYVPTFILVTNMYSYVTKYAPTFILVTNMCSHVPKYMPTIIFSYFKLGLGNKLLLAPHSGGQGCVWRHTAVGMAAYSAKQRWAGQRIAPHSGGQGSVCATQRWVGQRIVPRAAYSASPPNTKLSSSITKPK